MRSLRKTRTHSIEELVITTCQWIEKSTVCPDSTFLVLRVKLFNPCAPNRSLERACPTIPPHSPDHDVETLTQWIRGDHTFSKALLKAWLCFYHRFYLAILVEVVLCLRFGPGEMIEKKKVFGALWRSLPDEAWGAVGLVQGLGPPLCIIGITEKCPFILHYLTKLTMEYSCCMRIHNKPLFEQVFRVVSDVWRNPPYAGNEYANVYTFVNGLDII